MTAPRSKEEIQPKQPKPVLNVPAYFLYGEVWTAETFGFFHIEPLSVRNVPNDWRIGLHTHPDFDQISIVFSGDCSFEHDGQPAHVLGACCVFTPADVVHQFQYRRDSRGYVVSVSSDFTDSLAFDDSAIKAAMLNLARARQVSLVPRGAVAALERLAKLMADCFALQHIKATLEYAGSSIDKIGKVNIYLDRRADFDEMNEIYKEFFGSEPSGWSARTTVEARLPRKDFLLEIDCVAEA